MPTPSKPPQRTAPAKQATKPAAPAARQQAPAAAQKPAAKPPAVIQRPSTAVAQQAATAVTVPDYMRAGGNRGSENVEMQDVIIPRIELVQALSKCLVRGSGDFIEGAEAGMFYNSVTRELYPPEVVVCPVFFKKQYLVWKDQKSGGGFGGAFDNIEDASARIAQETRDQELWEAIETAQQIVLVVVPQEDGSYSTSEAVISMARTKLKVSRQWNSLIRVNGHDRFSRIYGLSGVDETNTNNQSYKNLMVRYIDFAPMEVYKAAETLYDSISAGIRKVVVDDNYVDVGYGAEDVGSEHAQGAGKDY